MDEKRVESYSVLTIPPCWNFIIILNELHAGCYLSNVFGKAMKIVIKQKSTFS